ncbi:hypothetical protein ACHAXT_005409 [Thalassiosira profunda]
MVAKGGDAAAPSAELQDTPAAEEEKEEETADGASTEVTPGDDTADARDDAKPPEPGAAAAPDTSAARNLLTSGLPADVPAPPAPEAEGSDPPRRTTTSTPSTLGPGAHRIVGWRASESTDVEGGDAPPQANHELDAPGTSALVEASADPHVAEAYLVEGQDAPLAEAEEVEPFFKRKEGKVTLLVVGGLVAALAILLGVFLGRKTEEEPMPSDVPSSMPSGMPSFDDSPTLDTVRERGVLNCGIEDVTTEGDVNLGGNDVDQCRGVAAVIFGDPDKVNLVTMGTDDHYERLEAREVDVLFAGDTFTLERLLREPTTGRPVTFGYPYYTAAVVYIGLETYVQCANNQKRYDECEDLSICAVDTPEIRSLIAAFFPASFFTFGLFPEMEASLKDGTCNVLVTDTYRIYGSSLQYDFASGKYVISDNHISRNLLASVVRRGDAAWYDIVEGARTGAFRAHQLGIGKDESQCPVTANNNSASARDDVSFYNAATCVGNHVQVFQRHLGETVLSYSTYLSAIDAPNWGNLECDACEIMDRDGRLEEIRDRGQLNCAVYLNPEYNLTRSSLATLVNVKYCEILAVAILQGKPDAVNITYIDDMDYSVYPREFDAVAGAAWESRVGFNTNNLGTMSQNLPYFVHDKRKAPENGVVYDGVGLYISYAFDNDDTALHGIAVAAITATIFAQRQGITRSTSFAMPQIHLLGDSLTFMLRDVIAYAGNYDDIINEALAQSDGATERGWNTVIPNYFVAAKIPVNYCDYTGNCPPCQWIENPAPLCISVGPY